MKFYRIILDPNVGALTLGGSELDAESDARFLPKKGIHLDQDFFKLFKIEVTQAGELSDFLPNDFGWLLVSEKVARVFLRMANEFVELIRFSSPGIFFKIEGDYFLVNILTLPRCVDFERSESRWSRNLDGVNYISSIYKLVLDGSRIPKGCGIFRPGEYPVALLISEEIRRALVSSGVSGVRFLPVDISERNI